MKFTDIFIERPVLATVVSLMIFVLGLRSITSLPIRQYPNTENAVITVTTTYTGADPATIAGFITTPLEASLAQSNGIDYMQSTSTPSTSTIAIYLRLNYDVNKALSEINTRVSAVLNQLPRNAQLPVTTIDVGESLDSMYIAFYSDVLEPNKINDYILRIVQPKLQTINGVQVAEIIGSRQYAMRIWLDPVKLAALHMTATDVANALDKNNFVSAVGRTDGNLVAINLKANTDLTTVDQFNNLIIRAQNGAIIRIKDVGYVSLGATNYDQSVKFNRLNAIYIGIKLTPTANMLSTLSQVARVFDELHANLPHGLNAKIVYDASDYVDSSIKEVIKSLIEAIVIVTVVVFVFLGSIRSVIVPIVAIPLSLIGAFFMMLLLGYSINLLTLLALVLAIGLVVDDAIIVVENIHRHMEAGLSPIKSALIGARELTNPIIAITVVLIAVYLPIGFMGGLTGALFTEFAFTLAGTVTLSAIVALTLSPMMCSKFLKLENHAREGIVKFIDKQFERLSEKYQGLLNDLLNYLPVLVAFSAVIFVAIYFLFIFSQSELAPQEDQGIIITQLIASPNASLSQTQLYSDAVTHVLSTYPEGARIFQLDGLGGLNQALIGMGLKPWDDRARTTEEILPELQEKLDNIPGGKIVAFERPPLPGGGKGLPVQFVIQTTEPFNELYKVSQQVMEEARKTGKFIYLDNDLKIDKVQTMLILDRDKISQMGLTMQDVGDALGYAMNQNYINYYDLEGRSYQVIPQLVRKARINATQLLNYYINSSSGQTIPLSTIASLKQKVVPQSLNHFQQLNSATISAMMRPGVSIGDSLHAFQVIAKQILPQGYTVDYAAQSRQYVQEGTALIVTFFFALIIIFLSLAALFESFRDPLAILVSVPMSICGAMIFICLGVNGATLNIYTEVGLVTLIGLISKHGILIVQFANDLQAQGKSKRDAIELAAKIRLRPILMTTAAMVFGVIPLILATGAGAVSRFNIGLVIASGISIGTLFTLFVVPAMYMILGSTHVELKNIAKQLPEA